MCNNNTSQLDTAFHGDVSGLCAGEHSAPSNSWGHRGQGCGGELPRGIRDMQGLCWSPGHQHLSFAPKVLTSSTSVGKQPGCGEEIQLCPVASAPCLPHLPYTQHVSVIKGIKTSKAAAGRSFVMCSVPVPEDSCALPRVLAWSRAE